MCRLAYLLTTLAATFAGVSHTRAQSTAGLIVHLPLNGNAQDVSGNNYNGTMAVPPVPGPDATGTPGQAIYFNGAGKITISNPAKLRVPFPEMTVMVKLCPDDVPYIPGTQGPPFPNSHSFFCWSRPVHRGWTTQPIDFHEMNLLYEVGYNRQHYGLWDFNGKPDCATFPRSEAHDFLKDSVRIVKKWFAFTWVLKNGKVSQYYNCDKMFEYDYPNPQFFICTEDSANPITLVLGTHGPYPGHHFDVNTYKGFMDDFRIYNRALDSGEIAAYSAGFRCGRDVVPKIRATKIPCTNNTFEISDASEVYANPIVSRKWTIVRDNFTTTDSAFTYTFSASGLLPIHLSLIDAEGLPFTLDTALFVPATNQPGNFIKTDRKDYILCGGQSSVQVKLTGAVTYSWSPCIDLNVCDSGTVTVTPRADRIYTVAGVTVQGCPDTIKITVKKSTDNNEVFVPSAFTPNNDGVNDVLGIQSASPPGNFQFEVYNRWGEQVFKTSYTLATWNGTFNYKKQPAGMYLWKLQYSGGPNCPETRKKGTVVLIR